LINQNGEPVISASNSISPKKKQSINYSNSRDQSVKITNVLNINMS